MIRTTRWHPDTCDCILEYTWDDEVPDAIRTHTPARVVRCCPEHAHLKDDVSGHHTAIVDDNRLKNLLRA